MKTESRYLQEVFQLNPVWQATQLMKHRAKFFSLATMTGEAEEKQAMAQVDGQVRERIKNLITSVQTEFWQLPILELQSRLAYIAAHEVPELAATLRRLQRATECRTDFPRLSQEPSMDKQLFSAFKRIVVLPSTEAGLVREQFIHRMQFESKRRISALKESVQFLRFKYPKLYELEEGWFNSLLKLQHLETTSFFSSSGLGDLSYPAIVLIFILVRALLAIVQLNGQ